MIPNVDEEAVNNEFNLKQIDAPMPEAPWIRRLNNINGDEPGIKFTDNILLKGDEEDDETLGEPEEEDLGGVDIS